jgi:hypothetical protein
VSLRALLDESGLGPPCGAERVGLAFGLDRGLAIVG